MSPAGAPAATPTAQTGLGYASGPGRWVLLVTLLGSALASVDATVVGIALPAIGRDFSVSLTSLQWVVTSYTLTLAGLLLFAGTLGDRYGRKRIFLVGVVWFALASLICGLAPDATLLIGARADWLANFALIVVFPVWQNAISLGGVMVCFAALALAAVAFVYWFLPETKGLPVEEIVRVFERQKEIAAPVTYRPTVKE